MESELGNDVIDKVTYKMESVEQIEELWGALTYPDLENFLDQTSRNKSETNNGKHYNVTPRQKITMQEWENMPNMEMFIKALCADMQLAGAR